MDTSAADLWEGSLVSDYWATFNSLFHYFWIEGFSVDVVIAAYRLLLTVEWAVISNVWIVGRGLRFQVAVAVMLSLTVGRLGLRDEAQSWTLSADTAAPRVVPTG